jgi:hypothetical protein
MYVYIILPIKRNTELCVFQNTLHWKKIRFRLSNQFMSTKILPILQMYQLLVHGRWFSPGSPASSTTKTGRHDIAEILLKEALSTKKSINQYINILFIQTTKMYLNTTYIFKTLKMKFLKLHKTMKISGRSSRFVNSFLFSLRKRLVQSNVC